MTGEAKYRRASASWEGHQSEAQCTPCMKQTRLLQLMLQYRTVTALANDVTFTAAVLFPLITKLCVIFTACSKGAATG